MTAIAVLAEAMEVPTEVEHVMEKMLIDIDEGTIQNTKNDQHKSENGDKYSKRGSMSSTDLLAATVANQTGVKPRPTETINGKKEPIVIDLDDEDDMDYSKENIINTPTKSLTTLTRTLTAKKTSEVLCKIKLAVSKLSREVLEDMYCKKIEEFAQAAKHMSNLEEKVNQLNVYKDKVHQKTQFLEKQVRDLSTSMKNVTENVARNPKHLQQQGFTPIKFFRAVGVQVRTEPLPRLRAPLVNKSNNPPPPLAPAKQPPTVVTNTGNTAKPNGVITVGQGFKRVNKPTISVVELQSQVQPQVDKATPTPPKVARRAGPASARIGATATPKPPQLNTVSSQLTSVATQLRGTDTIIMTNGVGTSPKLTSIPGIIDLTGETKTNTGGRIIVNQNGVQYRVLDTSTLSPMQIITTTAGGGFQLVPTQTQSRPIVFQQTLRGTTPIPGQTIVRQAQAMTISPRQQLTRHLSPIGIGVRSGASQTLPPRPALSIASPRQTNMRLTSAALNSGQFTIRNVVNGTIPGTHFLTSKFKLPELPASSAQPKKPKEPPPPPTLTLQEQGGGIVLSWSHAMSAIYAEIQSYQIYACQEPMQNAASMVVKAHPLPQWKRVGDVKALPLPMACTLSQFTAENRYHFIVRGVDVYNRTGYFCEVVNILLRKRTK